MGKRRNWGEGSLYQDLQRGGWIAIVDLGADAQGRRQRRTVRGRTKAETIAKMEQVKAARQMGVPAGDASVTAVTWLEHWATHTVPRTVSARTAKHYALMLRCYVIPYIGKVRMARLSVEHVERMMASLEARGLAPATVAQSRTVLRRALADAERRGIVARNVAALAPPPRRAPARLDDALDAQEAAAVLAAASGDRLEALAVLVLGTGLRQGEALRLRWDDVDLDAGTLSVAKAKTPAGLRTIALPAIVVRSLVEHRARQRVERVAAERWDDPGLVFATRRGCSIHRSAALRWWWEITIKAGVGRRRMHASRHTAATLLLNAGVPLEVVSKTLGHAGLAITSDVYAKVRPELQRSAATAMDRVLGGA
jgi:integrase